MSVNSPERFTKLRVSFDRVGSPYRTANGGFSAHYEHTVVITRCEPVLLTAS
jgi:methionine aminopeptidase